MTSKFLYRCGDVIRTNLGEGHNNYLMIPESVINIPDDYTSDKLHDDIWGKKDTVVICSKCKNLYVIDEDYKITAYKNISERNDD